MLHYFTFRDFLGLVLVIIKKLEKSQWVFIHPVTAPLLPKWLLEVNDTHKKDAYLKARLQKSTAGMELAESEINLLIWDLRAKSHK